MTTFEFIAAFNPVTIYRSKCNCTGVLKYTNLKFIDNSGIWQHYPNVELFVNLIDKNTGKPTTIVINGNKSSIDIANLTSLDLHNLITNNVQRAKFSSR